MCRVSCARRALLSMEHLDGANLEGKDLQDDGVEMLSWIDSSLQGRRERLEF